MSGINYDDILDAFEGEEKKLVPADKGTRLANFIIDYILIYILNGVASFFIGMASFILMDFLMVGDETFLFIMLISYGTLFGIFVLYYALSEHWFNGKTPAKFITRTRVVKLDGSQPTFMNLLGRSAARLIPFEPFSFLGASDTGWHDSFSNTMVVRD